MFTDLEYLEDLVSLQGGEVVWACWKCSLQLLGPEESRRREVEGTKEGAGVLTVWSEMGESS